MNRINNNKEYYQVIILILKNILKSSNKPVKNTIGIKNNILSQEILIKNILNKYCLENKKEEIKNDNKNKFNNLFYEYQPNGSQKPPDFLISCENFEKIKLECKSSKSNKPLFNCSLPNNETIYIFNDTKKSKTYISYGDDIINSKKFSYEKIYNEVKNFYDNINKLTNNFNNLILKDTNIKYYPRKMFIQKNKMEDIIDNEITFKKIKNNFKKKLGINKKL